MELSEHRVGCIADIPEPGALEFRLGKHEWPFRGFVVRWQGEVFAYANSCAHLGHALNLAKDQFFNSTDELLICSSHGALFEPDTGLCVGGPCAGKRLISLTCRVSGADIYVRAPESQRDLPRLES